MAPAEQKAGHVSRSPQMLALKPGVEFGLSARTAIIPDRQNSGLRARHRYFAATTMISTL